MKKYKSFSEEFKEYQNEIRLGNIFKRVLRKTGIKAFVKWIYQNNHIDLSKHLETRVIFDKIFKNNNNNRLLGKITGCTFEEIKKQLPGMKVTVFNITAEGFYTRFSDRYTEYVLSFSSNSIVIGIITEHWKDMDVLINY